MIVQLIQLQKPLVTHILAKNSTTYSSSGTYTHISSDANNCVQVDTLHLTINNSNGSTDNVIACNSYTWIDGNTYTASNSSATFTDTNVDGCD